MSLKGMFGWLPWVDKEEPTPEQQFFDHFKKTGKVLTNNRGQPVLKFQDAEKLFQNNRHKALLNYLYEKDYPGFY
jgi:ferritin